MNDGFKIRSLKVGFAPGTASLSKVVGDQIDGWLVRRHERRVLGKVNLERSTFVRACDESRGGEYLPTPSLEPVRRGGPGVSSPHQPRRGLGPLTSVR